MEREREVLETDVLIVGGGPAGLACALHLKRLLGKDAPGSEVSCTLIEKGAALGNHSLSGAVMDPRGMLELMPDFREQGFPLEGEVLEDSLHYLTPQGAIHSPRTRSSNTAICSSRNSLFFLSIGCEAAGALSSWAANCFSVTTSLPARSSVPAGRSTSLA